jgi:hypothetical protein
MQISIEEIDEDEEKDEIDAKDAIDEAIVVQERNAGPSDPALRNYFSATPTIKSLIAKVPSNAWSTLTSLFVVSPGPPL